MAVPLEHYGLAWRKRCQECAWSQERMLESLEPGFRVVIERLLDRMQELGWHPILVSAWRSLEPSQRLLYENEDTRVAFSYHNVVDASGAPAALAVDIVDERYQWGEHERDNGEDASEMADFMMMRKAISFFQDLAHEMVNLYLYGSRMDSSSHSSWNAFRLVHDPAHVQAEDDVRIHYYMKKTHDTLRSLGRMDLWWAPAQKSAPQLPAPIRPPRVEPDLGRVFHFSEAPAVVRRVANPPVPVLQDEPRIFYLPGPVARPAAPPPQPPRRRPPPPLRAVPPPRPPAVTGGGSGFAALLALAMVVAGAGIASK